MEIKRHFQIQLNEDQQNVVEQLESFLSTDTQVFLLKGYAGTGKTTLVKGLIDALKEERKHFLVCAPTGRAAKVLRNKTAHGKTIHSTIYDFDNLITKNAEKEDVAEHSFEYFFPIKKLDKETIIIVDEASMISSRENKNELFTFGTNILLDDLLTFSQLQSNHCNKIIFIGDPAQLAPVGDNNSWALEPSFFENKKLKIEEVFLTKVMRQSDNLILENAMAIRNCIDNPTHRKLKFQFDDQNCFDYNNKNVVEKYCNLFPIPSFDNGIIINFSNAQNYWYNKEIRNCYFPNSPFITEGDIVQIINNNYHKYNVEIFNGDFAQIIAVGGITKLSAPVFVDVAGKKQRKNIEVTYRKVTFRLPDYDEDIEAYINETLLESTAKDLNIDEMKAVYINAVMRFREKYPNGKINSEIFKNFLKNDDFYNAIRVKYGYSITGHKSQGGEWKHVFVDYYGRVSLKNDPLRWSYTATTRASECLYAINCPNFGKYQKLNFSNIEVFSNVPNEAFNFERVPTSPFHSESSHKCKSWLYWNVVKKLTDTNFDIVSIKSENYCEKYVFSYFGEFINAEIFHKGSGYFEKDFIFSSGSEETTQQLKDILKIPNKVIFNSIYQPTEDFLAEWYSIISAACTDLDIRILNVSEHVNQYYVNYFFETENKVSYIQFWFKKTGEFTKANVKTIDKNNDQKLLQLIKTIEEYAAISTN